MTREIILQIINKTEDDILLRKELEAIPKDRLKLFYTLDEPPAGWKGGKGFINEDMCKEHLPSPGPDTMIFNCGPPVRHTASHLPHITIQYNTSSRSTCLVHALDHSLLFVCLCLLLTHLLTLFDLSHSLTNPPHTLHHILSTLPCLCAQCIHI